MATVAICDVHGDAHGLEQVLRALEPELDPAHVVVFLGDLIDRGPDSKGVLEQVCALAERRPGRVEALQGNHEEWLLETWRDFTRHSWLIGMEGLATVASYDPALADELRARVKELGPRLVLERTALPYQAFFAALPAAHARLLREGLRRFVRTPDVLCVHAGVALGEDPLADLRALTWGEPDFPDAYRGSQRVVYGHRGDALPDGRPRVGPRGTTWGIDTSPQGIVTALRFPDLALFQSQPRR